MTAKRIVWAYCETAILTALKIVLFPLGKANRERCYLEISQALAIIQEVPIGSGDMLSLFCPSYDALFRANDMLIKEPETLRWIDSFEKDEVLWDIGANVGVYSLYAAKKRNVQVIAFEPSAANYWILNKNIELNRLDKNIRSFCLALSLDNLCGTFNMADTSLGGACYHFGQGVTSFNYPGLGTQQVVFQQGMLGLSIDNFVKIFNPPFPTHIKIDVDGIEESILRGAVHALGDSRLRSISVELTETEEDVVSRVIELLKMNGLHLVQKEHSEKYGSGHSEHIFNYLFLRK